MAEADTAYKNAQYQVALDNYAKVIEKDPENSKARVGYVNSYAKVRFVDFLYIAQEVGKTNFNLTVLLNDPIVKQNIVGSTGVFQVTIDQLSKITSGECDGEIAVTDFNVNIQLSLSYLLRGLILMADSDGDGIIASTNAGSQDLLVLNGLQVGFNEKVLNFEAIASNIQTASSMSGNTNINGGGGDPLSIFLSVGNASDLTNLTLGTNSSFRYFVEAIHDSVEISLNLLKVAATSITYFNNSFASINRIFSKYSESPTVGQLARNIGDLNTEVNQYASLIETPYAMTFNTFHNDLIGSYAYLGSVKNFSSSSFQSHLNDPATGGLVGIMKVFSSSDPLPLTNAQNLFTLLSNATSIFTNADIMSQIQQWLQIFGQP